MTRSSLTDVPDRPQHFASDNYSGICPEAWAAMAEANEGGHAPAYGDDRWTKRAADAFRTLFERDCEIFFVYNGTAANSLALAALCRSYHSVVCTATAHVEIDECGAPEFFSGGSKLLTAPSADGKLTVEGIRAKALGRRPLHFPQPRAVTITQSTETGRVYSLDEIATISKECRDLGLHLHMDGARFANACASLGASPADATWRAGVDVLCFGGTKNGMAAGEAVVFFDRALAEDFDYRCKQAGQLASKMRFTAAPWIGMLESGAWLRNAAHANGCAQRLATAIAERARSRGAVPAGSQRRFRTRRRAGARRVAGARLAFLHVHRRRRPLHVRLGHRSRGGRPACRRSPRSGCTGRLTAQRMSYVLAGVWLCAAPDRARPKAASRSPVRTMAKRA